MACPSNYREFYKLLDLIAQAMEVKTQLAISQTLCGTILQAGPPLAIVELDLIDSMRTDDTGLVHGGFNFGAADYAAMAAVNDANVVLASANVRFL